MKKKSNKKKRKSKQTNKKEEHSPYSRAILKLALSFLTGLATMFGILSYLQPNISVSPLITLDPNRPLSTQFQITNNGYLPIHHVKYSLGIERIKGRMDFRTYGDGVDPPKLSSPEHKTGKSIGSHQSDTINIGFKILTNAEPIQYADIKIIVLFRPIFFPWYQKLIYRFITLKSKDGKLYWIPKS